MTNPHSLRGKGYMPLQARLLAQIQMPVSEAAEACWIWTGAKNAAGAAYGRTLVKSRLTNAHRAVYECFVGPIPPGLVLDHLCRNRSCVNPKHLEPVPQRTNVMRGLGLAAANARKTCCPKGHPYDAMNIYGKRICRPCANERARRRKEAA